MGSYQVKGGGKIEEKEEKSAPVDFTQVTPEKKHTSPIFKARGRFLSSQTFSRQSVKN
jgi:hypothetical protein